MSVFDVNDILKSLDNDENAFLIDHTHSSIKKAKNNALQKLGFPASKLKEIHAKLARYRYVDDLSTLKYGSYIRWIRITNPDVLNLTSGGIMTDIKINATGCNIQCKNQMNRFFEIKFDDCIIFQKLTEQECILLDVLSYLSK